MKRWQKATVLIVVTPLLVLAAKFMMSLTFAWHFFFVAQCNGISCEDYGAGLYSAALWAMDLVFTAYFFFAFVWLFKEGARDAAGR